MHLVDEEWNLPRRENDINDLTYFSNCQTGRPHSTRRHVEGTLLKIPEPQISPSDANFVSKPGVVTHCSRVVYMNTYVSEEHNASMYEISYPKKDEDNKVSPMFGTYQITRYIAVPSVGHSQYST